MHPLWIGVKWVEIMFWIGQLATKPDISVRVGLTPFWSQVWPVTPINNDRSRKSEIASSILRKRFRLAPRHPNPFTGPTSRPNESTHSLWTPSRLTNLPPTRMQLRRNGWTQRKTRLEVQKCKGSEVKAWWSQPTDQAWSRSSKTSLNFGTSRSIQIRRR